MITRLWADHKADMTELDKGAKPTEEILKSIELTALSTAKGFEG